MVTGQTPLDVVAVDVGGTFIDFLGRARDGSVRVHKVLSRPGEIAAAFLEGLADIAPDGARRVVHGTTVATNALLERRGARTALITTDGFADVLEIGRQDRPELYALSQSRPPPLVPRDLRFEVRERLAYDGSVVVPLDEDALHALAARLGALGVESVAVTLLFSFARRDHERRVADVVRAALPECLVTASHEVIPEFREYERTATTAANAYVSPVIARYVTSVAHAVTTRGVSTFEVMQSSGGVLDATEAAGLGVRLILSGPAGGVVGGFEAARAAGFDRAITLDMGGTSTDVALCDGDVPTTTEAVVAGVPIRLPMVDVHTVGAGGGSLARVDAGGALRVGPESAGADPGPACYGRGALPTVTDAQALAGRLDTESFLGGRLALDLDRSRWAFERLGSELGVPFGEAVYGVLHVVNSAMERAIRRVSVERGHHPRDFTLVAFGGAGPLHACELAEALEIPRVLVPRFPGVASAAGMAAAERTRDLSRTVMVPVEAASERAEPAWRELEEQARRLLPGGTPTRRAECRYRGQGYELEVAAGALADAAALAAAFHEAHRLRYGYATPDRPVELVTVRVHVRESRDRVPASHVTVASDASRRSTRLLLDGAFQEAPVIRRDTLAAGRAVTGAALIVQPDSATLVPRAWAATVVEDGALLVERRAG